MRERCVGCLVSDGPSRAKKAQMLSRRSERSTRQLRTAASQRAPMPVPREGEGPLPRLAFPLVHLPRQETRRRKRPVF